MRIENTDANTLIGDRIAVATSYLDRLRGLIGRHELPAGEGLWFPGDSSIHMMFMSIPIDAAFVRRVGHDTWQVVKASHGLRPWLGFAAAPGAQGVIELPAGTLAATRTDVGSRLRLID